MKHSAYLLQKQNPFHVASLFLIDTLQPGLVIETMDWNQSTLTACEVFHVLSLRGVCVCSLMQWLLKPSFYNPKCSRFELVLETLTVLIRQSQDPGVWFTVELRDFLQWEGLTCLIKSSVQLWLSAEEVWDFDRKLLNRWR